MRKLDRFATVLLLTVAMAACLNAQPVNLNIQPSNNSVVASCPAGLDLVQPQKPINLAVGIYSGQSQGSAFGTINTVNSLSGTIVPLGLTVSGPLNPTTKVISGSYRMGSKTLGTLTLPLAPIP